MRATGADIRPAIACDHVALQDRPLITAEQCPRGSYQRDDPRADQHHICTNKLHCIKANPRRFYSASLIRDGAETGERHVVRGLDLRRSFPPP